MARFKNSHRRALESIQARPELFGIYDVIASAIEMNLRDNHGRVIAQPDVVFFLRTSGTSIKKVRIIEYKNNGYNQKKADKQLSVASTWFRKNGYEPVAMFIDGNRYPEIHERRKNLKYDRRNGTRDPSG